LVVSAVLSSLSAFAAPPGGPRFTKRATDLGATSSSQIVPVTVWMKVHSDSALEQRVQAAHDPSSTSFQRWTSDATLDAAHAPTAAEVASVSAFLTANGLKVTGVGAHNLFVTASGSAAQVQAAFKTQLRDYAVGNRRYFANTAAPALPSQVQGLVAHVGLDNLDAKPLNVRPGLPKSDFAPTAAAPLAANPGGLLYSAGCFRAPQTVHFSSTDAVAVYSGNRYGQDNTNTTPGTLPSCGYQPSDIQTAYNLNRLYRNGLDGSGQTVAIVDAYGSTTIAQDLAAFSSLMGLPPANLRIIGTPTQSNYSTDPEAGWAGETTLDVEWVHAIAPGAKIVLVVTPTNSFDDLFQGIITAAQIPGVTAISNSWSTVEFNTYPEFRIAADGVFKAIAAKGISVDFSSGDSGDEAINLGMNNVDWPASSPFVTAIGGVSLSLRQNKQIDFQTAWGNNLTKIANPAGEPLDPVANYGFQFGGGGGVSDVYAKPLFQRGVQGSRRTVPDISWVADPFTGVEIVFTGDSEGGLYVDVIGGTSLSCPMFSGLWAIASQAAGHRLGQAAQSIYRLDSSAITDVTEVTSRNNVSGLIRDPYDSPEIPSDLAAPLQNLPSFYSALFNSSSGSWWVMTFGTDASLPVGPGYDLATGLGTPNPPRFVDALAH